MGFGFGILGIFKGKMNYFNERSVFKWKLIDLLGGKIFSFFFKFSF